MKKEFKAYINHYESLCCAGSDMGEIFGSLFDETPTITQESEFIDGHTVAIGKIKNSASFDELLLKTCKKVLEKSNLNDFNETLLVVGSSVGGIALTENIFFKENSYTNINPNFHTIQTIANILKKDFHFYDDISFSTACTSSTNALGYAKEVLQKGIYKSVLVVGADSLSHTTVCGFFALGVLSSSTCRPFDTQRDGMNVSEAISVLLLQNEPCKNSVELCGVGYSSDAHHITQPHPEGAGAKKAMLNALNDAQLSPKQIDYINAHGTGTKANDLAESKAINSVFGSEVFVSSTKSSTGHTLGASGAIECTICCEVLHRGVCPPNKGLSEAELKELNYTTPKLDPTYILSNSFAFGGNNTSIILKRSK